MYISSVDRTFPVPIHTYCTKQVKLDTNFTPPEAHLGGAHSLQTDGFYLNVFILLQFGPNKYTS